MSELVDRRPCRKLRPGCVLDGFVARAAVDSQAQVIVAAEVTQAANDSQQLAPRIEQAAANMGRKPEAIGADAGYWSEDNVSDEHAAGIDLHIATGRQKHPHGEASETATGPPAEQASVQEAMRHKLRTEAGHAIYKMRKAIVEPVFGQTRERRGFRRFTFRGKDNVGAEWKLICLTHNLLKLFILLESRAFRLPTNRPKRLLPARRGCTRSDAGQATATNPS